MRIPRAYSRFAGLFALFAIAPTGFGDAPCNKGFRDTTPGERARISASLQAAKDALPAAPEGWRIQGDDQFSVPSSLCKDRELFPWQYSFTRSYVQVADAAQREKIMRDAAAAMAATQAKNQARLEALQAQMQQIMQQQMALNQKRDYAGAEKLEPQRKKVEAEYEKLATESSQAIAAAGQEYERDLYMSIAVEVNGSDGRPGPDAMQLARPAGARAAIRWPSENPDDTNDRALFLFGNWTQDPEGWRWISRANVTAITPQAVSVTVTADRERLAGFVQQIDFTKIAAIVR